MTAIQGPSRTAAKAQSRSSSAADWTPTSWRGRPAQQTPIYADTAVLAGADAVAYPVCQIAYHHLVEDSVGGVPIVATY